MKLPQTIVSALEYHMSAHGVWHSARMPRQWVRFEDRAAWQADRDRFPDVKYVNELGSGKELLTFHRMMIRHFKWIVANTPGHSYVYGPWTSIPDWLRTPANPSGFSDVYIQFLEARIAALVEAGSLEELGGFLEPNKQNTLLYGGIHNQLHGLIAAVEYDRGEGYVGADMDDFATAHYNEHFWNLHGWIDNIYADWQRRHGEEPDQSALDPSEHEHGWESQPSVRTGHHGAEHARTVTP